MTTFPAARPAEPANRLICSDLCAGYGGRIVLRRVALNLRAGEIAAVVGPNGGGKSTLLRCLSGALPPTRPKPHGSIGEVLLDGRPLASLSPRERARRIAVLPQRPEAPAGLTAGELTLLGRYPRLAPHGLLTRRDREAARAALEAMGSLHLKDRPLAALSGGELQRVFLARALAQGADILLLDEPASAMDPARTADLFGLLRRLAESGACVAAVMHDINAACLYAHRIVGLKGGSVLFDLPPADLTPALLRDLYELSFLAARHPTAHTPLFFPPAPGGSAPLAAFSADGRAAVAADGSADCGSGHGGR